MEKKIDAAQIAERVKAIIKDNATLKQLKGVTNAELEAVYSLAFGYYQTGKFNEALKLFQFLVLFDHLNKKYWMGLGAVQQVLKDFEARAAEKDIKAAKPSFEGVRLVFPEGWALLRLSLHDPQMPLNIESRKAGGAKEIAQQVQELLAGFDALDFSVFNK